MNVVNKYSKQLLSVELSTFHTNPSCLYALDEIALVGRNGSGVVMATGLSRPGKSREGPGTGQDLETLKVPWSCGPRTKEVQKSRDFF